MPSCSVKICKNRSISQNLKVSGITYHRFPNDPKVKEAWINATGRTGDWFPTKTSTVCSEHFEENLFQVTKKSRRLFPWAVPSLKLELVYKELQEENRSSAKPIHPTSAIAITDNSSGTTEISQIILITDEPPPPPVIQASKPKVKVKVLLERKSNMIKEQKRKIKRLQTMVRRYKKKYLEIESVLENLQHNPLINDRYSILHNSAEHATRCDINELAETSLTSSNQ